MDAVHEAGPGPERIFKNEPAKRGRLGAHRFESAVLAHADQGLAGGARNYDAVFADETLDLGKLELWPWSERKDLLRHWGFYNCDRGECGTSSILSISTVFIHFSQNGGER